MTTAASELHLMHAVREMKSKSRCDHHSRSLKYVHEGLRFHEDRKCSMVTLLRHSLESGQKWHENGVLTSLPKWQPAGSQMVMPFGTGAGGLREPGGRT